MGACASTQSVHPLPTKTDKTSEKSETSESLNNEHNSEVLEQEERTSGASGKEHHVEEVDNASAHHSPEVGPEEEEEEEDTGSYYDSEINSDFVFEIEKAVDEVQLSAVKDDYPPPKPPIPTKLPLGTDILFFNGWVPELHDEIHSLHNERYSSGSRPVTTATATNVTLTLDQDHVTVEDVDEHAKKAPRSALKSFSDLIGYLTQNLQYFHNREMLTARAILSWLGNQNMDKFKSGTGNEETPEGFLTLLAQQKTTYSTLFTILCREAGIMCVQIKGVAKCSPYSPGDKDMSDMECVWNAVYCDGQWHIVHPFWTCVCLFGNSAGGWIGTDPGRVLNRKLQRQRKTSVGVLRDALKEYYFDTNPKEFLHICLPNDEQWQLLEKPVSRDEFLAMPYLLPTFFALGLKVVSKQKCVMKAENGSLSIELRAPLRNADVLIMWYELFLQDSDFDSDADDDMCATENISRLVTMIRNGDEWKFNMQFPVEGTYKFCLYGGPHKSTLLRLCEFRLNCEQRKKHCFLLPFDPGTVGFGPGPISEEAGLFIPSHRNGFISAKSKSDLKCVFHIDGHILQYMAVRSELIDMDSGQRTRVKHDINHEAKLLKLKTHIQHDGDYILTILTGTGNRFIPAYKESNGYMNVCNYYISTMNNQALEKTSQRIARKALEDVFESEDIDKIQSAIQKCIKERIAINDDQISAATARLEFLKTRKKLRDALMRRNTEIVNKTIDMMKHSPYKKALQSEVSAIHKLKKKLDTLGVFTQRVPELHESLQELEYKIDPKQEIHDTLQALFILLGEPKGSLKNWESIAKLIHPTGINEHTALHKMKDVQDGKKGIHIDNARSADRLLRKHSIDDVRRVNMAAATVYHWVDIVLKMCFEVHQSQEEI